MAQCTAEGSGALDARAGDGPCAECAHATARHVAGTTGVTATPKSPPARRFSLNRLALAAFLRVLTQTLLAWGIAWRHDPNTHTEIGLDVARPPGSTSPVATLHLYRCQSWGRIWIGAIARIPPRPFEHLDRHPGPVADFAAPWSLGDLYPPLADPSLWPSTLAPGNAREVSLLRADGWPMPSLWYRYTYNPVRPMPYDLSGAVEVPWLSPRDPMLATGPLALAYQPVWPGLAVNTLVYTSAWWAMLVLPAALRRRVRARRGGCPSCGYDLRATPAPSPCPECGRPAASRRGQWPQRRRSRIATDLRAGQWHSRGEPGAAGPGGGRSRDAAAPLPGARRGKGTFVVH